VLSRRQRKLLEELAPHIAPPQSRPMPIDEFVSALTRGELRTAFLLTGDLLSIVEELRAGDATLRRATDLGSPQALGVLLAHPLAGDVARFALSAEASALRRRVGSTWSGGGS
jgi:hypothetical protein